MPIPEQQVPSLQLAFSKGWKSPRRSLFKDIVGALFLTFFAATAQAQPSTSAPPEDGIFFESVNVNVVNVEVFVTDSEGNPVRGLTQEDFELREAGKLVEVTNFLAIQEGQVVEGPSSGSTKAPTYSAPIPENQRLHVVLFVDHLNMHPRYRNQILSHLRRFLREGLGPQDRVMLASFDGTLKIEKNFTSVPELIQPLIDGMHRRNSRAFEVETGMRSIIRDIDSVDLSDSVGAVNIALERAREILANIESFSQEMLSRNRFTLLAMEDLVESLAGLPGRKALVYVSGGMPLRPGLSLMEAWNNKFETFGRSLGASSVVARSLNYDSTKDFQDFISTASGNRVVVYTIDAVANRSLGAVSAETGGFDMSAIGTASGGRAMPVELSHRQNANFRSSMQIMAAGTGGLTFINTKSLGTNLSKLANDFRTYYSLGYRPDRKADGKFRSLKVKVEGKGFRVRHRSGFRDKTTDETMGDQTLAALLLNVTDNPLEITLERAPGKKSRKKRYEVPVLVKIPIGNLALLPDEAAHRGKVQVYLAVADSKGGGSRIEKRTLPVNIPADRINEALGQYIGHEFTLLMKGGFHRLAVTVRDEIAAVSSTVRVNFRVGEERPEATGRR